MNIKMIEDYVKTLRREDLANFARRQGIFVDTKDLQVIYEYIKKEYKKIIWDSEDEVLRDIRTKISPQAYEKVVSLYEKFKDKITILKQNIREN